MANKNTVANRRAGVFGNAPFNLDERRNSPKRYKMDGPSLMEQASFAVKQRADATGLFAKTAPLMKSKESGKIVKKFNKFGPSRK